jgi:2-iminobutanoate/2-iminopropanoate deaminase
VNREAIATRAAPAAVGPYSQAIKHAGMVFASGQLGLDPETGKLREGVEAQAHQVLANLQAVLAAAGAEMEDVVKTTMFLVDMADFARVNAIYATAFPAPPPARSTIQVAALPLGGLVEIEVIAILKG